MSHLETCQRCGKCCHNMTWTGKYSYYRIKKSLPHLRNDELAKVLISNYANRLKTHGLPLKHLEGIFLKNDTLMVKMKTARCKHLKKGDGKFKCTNYNGRPSPCREFTCH